MACFLASPAAEFVNGQVIHINGGRSQTGKEASRPFKMAREHVHFVTGRLAEHSLRQVVEPLAQQAGFDFTVDVLPITVAALMTPEWIARRVKLLARCHTRLSTRLLLGRADADRTSHGRARRARTARPAATARFLRPRTDAAQTTAHTTSRFSPRSTTARGFLSTDIRAIARQLAADGADVIDVGCEPDGPWPGVADVVRALRDDGHRVSIDSLDPREIAPAVAAGAELVLIGQ